MVFSVLEQLGVNLNEAASHFSEVANKMRVCEPNGRLAFMAKKLDNVWIVRDYFPGTSFMFKVTMVYHSPEHQAEYNNKQYNESFVATDFSPKLWVNVKLIKPKYGKYKDKIYVPYEEAQKFAMAKAANIIIGDNITPEPFMPIAGTTNKRMYPKGYKHEDRPRKRSAHIHNKRKRSRKHVSSDDAGTVRCVDSSW